SERIEVKDGHRPVWAFSGHRSSRNRFISGDCITVGACGARLLHPGSRKTPADRTSTRMSMRHAWKRALHSGQHRFVYFGFYGAAIQTQLAGGLFVAASAVVDDGYVARK